MSPQDDMTTKLLLSAILALSGVVAALFYQLIRSKDEQIAAYKEILPTATLLMETVQALQKIIEREDHFTRRGGDA